MNYTKLNLDEIPIEQAHGGSGSRQMLVRPEYLTTSHLEAMTKGYLSAWSMFDWHNHPDTDEIFIVTQGTGKYFYRQNDREDFFIYKPEDVIIAPANLYHKIAAEGAVETQGFFFRIKAKENVTHSLRFSQKNIADLPPEPAHGVPGGRRTLTDTNMIASDSLEAITKGILNPEDHWGLHIHVNTDEIAIVLVGEGVWVVEGQEIPYRVGDIVVVPGNVEHRQIARTKSEFFFIRIQR